MTTFCSISCQKSSCFEDVLCSGLSKTCTQWIFPRISPVFRDIPTKNGSSPWSPRSADFRRRGGHGPAAPLPPAYWSIGLCDCPHQAQGTEASVHHWLNLQCSRDWTFSAPLTEPSVLQWLNLQCTTDKTFSASTCKAILSSDGSWHALSKARGGGAAGVRSSAETGRSRAENKKKAAPTEIECVRVTIPTRGVASEKPLQDTLRRTNSRHDHTVLNFITP